MAQRADMVDSELLDAAVDALTSRLPSSWVIEKASAGGDTEPQDLIIRSSGTASQAFVLVETRSSEVSARDVQMLMGGPWRRWRRQLGNSPLLLVAPYVGPRVRELLTEENVNYIDLTGNVRVSLDNPGVFILTQGADRNPRSARHRTGIKGAKAGAVVRVLADAAPPYSGAEIARVAKVDGGYLSRILDTLTDEGFLERESSGRVTRVDWPAVLRRRAQALDLFRPNGTFRYVARQGPGALLEVLRSREPLDRPPTVTGSFAAARLAPVAAPALLVIYTMSPRELETELSLLPAETGADTVLVRPDNDVAFARSAPDGGIAWAAPSQVAIDCLAGSGRMPSEGEALIDWMRQDENRWRYPSIRDLLEETPPPLA